MKQGIKLAGVAAGLVLGMNPAQAADDMTEQAVIAAWNTHDKALSEHDVDAVLATWADAGDSVLLGSGPEERWVGAAEIREAYENIVQDFDPYTMESICGWYVISSQGDTAWALAECDFNDSKNGDKREFPLNISAVLVNQDESWKFRALHFSTLATGVE